MSVSLYRNQLPCAPRSVASVGLLALLALLVFPESSVPSEPQYPACLMNWMVDGTFHALIVNKSEQQLTVWTIRDGVPSLVETFPCSTGERDGDKWIRGDMKTPEGVYFFCSVIDGKTLPPKYGLWAFTTDYPNFVDRRRGKSGDGIWLHGRDKPLGSKPDSNGCVALENQDLARVSKYIRLQGTPLIVLDKMRKASRSEILEEERQVRDFIEGWRQSWEAGDLEAYMGRYSRNFQSAWLDYDSWKEKKRQLYQRYKKIRVKLGPPYLYKQNGMVTAIFTQEYASDQYKSSGIKILYLIRDPSYKIYAEDYHKPVDDPFPVAPLLANLGMDPGVSQSENREFSIRLVSTDEPEARTSEDIEEPQNTPPSRAVVLERMTDKPTAAAPPLERNERTPATQLDRLVVARVLPAPTEIGSVAVREGLSTRALRPKVVPREEGQSESLPVSADKKEVQLSPRAGLSAPAPDDPQTLNQSRDLSLSEQNPPVTSAKERAQVQSFLNLWKQAWEEKNLDRFEKMYHPNFSGGNLDYANFVKSKKRFFRKYRNIRVNMDRVQIMKLGDKIIVRFLQSFEGDDYRDQGWKRMVLAGDKAEGFRIVREEWSPR